jgi:hypothetical protein
MSNVNFTRQLVKGKIAETIFSQMFRESGNFTVLEFGYEKVIPEMIQQGFNESNPMIETLRTAPDFAVIDRDTRQVKLIEVKYQRSLSSEYTLKAASGMSQSWNPSYLFIATLDGFFMDEIANIIKNNGEIAKLNHPKINSDLQNDYLQILKRFEQDN